MTSRLTSWWRQLRSLWHWDVELDLDITDIVPGASPPGDTPEAQAAHALKRAQNLLILAGSGLSAESGVATFRQDPNAIYQHKLWRTYTHRATFDADPTDMLSWHQTWRDEISTKTPNPAHHALIHMSQHIPKVLIATQNVDAFLETAAGPSPPPNLDILHLHGEITWVRCDSCGDRFEDPHFDYNDAPPCPHCQGMRRPDVVWFGEHLDHQRLAQAQRATQTADVCLIIGTSGLVQPAAGLAKAAAHAGCVMIEINPNASELSELVAVTLRQPAGVVLPKIVELMRPSSSK